MGNSRGAWGSCDVRRRERSAEGCQTAWAAVPASVTGAPQAKRPPSAKRPSAKRSRRGGRAGPRKRRCTDRSGGGPQ